MSRRKTGFRSLDQVIADDDDVAIAAITAAELLVGVESASGRRRTNRAAFVEEAFADLPGVALREIG